MLLLSRTGMKSAILNCHFLWCRFGFGTLDPELGGPGSLNLCTCSYSTVHGYAAKTSDCQSPSFCFFSVIIVAHRVKVVACSFTPRNKKKLTNDGETVKLYDVGRSWRWQAKTERCLFVSTSVQHPRSSEQPSSSSSSSSSSSCSSSTAVATSAAAAAAQVEARMIAGHYVVEPCGSAQSRLTHFSSIDFR